MILADRQIADEHWTYTALGPHTAGTMLLHVTMGYMHAITVTGNIGSDKKERTKRKHANLVDLADLGRGRFGSSKARRV
jgi:hypothetical protein